MRTFLIFAVLIFAQSLLAEGVVVKELQRPKKGALPIVAVSGLGGVHHLYDPNQLTVIGFWRGHFSDQNTKLKSFYLDRYPWSYGEKPRRTLTHQWQGTEVRDNQVFFKYRLEDKPSGMFWDVEETLEIVSDVQQNLQFSIKPSAPTALYLNYWLHQTDFRKVWTNGQPNQRNRLKNLQPNQEAYTVSFFRRKETPTMPVGYAVEKIAIPQPKKPFLFEPTDMDFADNGEVYVSTRTGQIWRRDRAGDWHIFADGLQEMNGIRVTADGNGVFVMQKPELTLLKDTDGDQVADVYETIEDRFRFTGQYHEFAYGPRINAQGDMFFSTGLASSGYFKAAPEGSPNQMTSALGYRGWVMKRTRDGELIPFASGLRSPAGIGLNAEGELFITDNQGDFVASSYLGHVAEGDFMGHPASLWDRPTYKVTPAVLDYASVDAIPKKVPPLDAAAYTKERKRPAVWLSHGDLTNSPGHPSFAPQKGFGPFGGQAFIADIAHRTVVRCALEKVAGEYQGAVFPFIRPLSSASYSTAFDPQGNLWVGSVGRGWISGDPAIEIIRYDEKKIPFEMHHIALTRNGFDIHFTLPLADRLFEPTSVSITEYDLAYWDQYGSEPQNEKSLVATSVQVSADGLVLSIEVPRRIEAIYQIELPGSLRAANDLVLDNNYGIYTLNQLLP